MDGDLGSANYHWQLAAKLKNSGQCSPVYLGYRILDVNWIAAIGHIAMLDYYFKYLKLYFNDKPQVSILVKNSSIAGIVLLKKYEKILGLKVFATEETLQEDYNLWASKNNVKSWEDLTEEEHCSLVDSFWHFSFPDNEAFGYPDALSKIQKEWEKNTYPPNLIIDKDDKTEIDGLLCRLGLPKGAWYVCLHVREPGYHQHWNGIYPSLRDADIEDYFEAINFIIQSGGWVLRMGDSSMKPISATSMNGVPGLIDFAFSDYKNESSDILLTTGCRFFLGTNSGFASIPISYGVPCYFTNWVPLGMPLWESNNKMIPKLYFDEINSRYLTIDELFAKKYPFIQNNSSLPKSVKVMNNTPDEILEMVKLAISDMSNPNKSIESADLSYYRQVSSTHGSYSGNSIPDFFIQKYSSIFLKTNVY